MVPWNVLELRNRHNMHMFHSQALADLELVILLPQSPESWKSRHSPQFLVGLHT